MKSFQRIAIASIVSTTLWYVFVIITNGLITGYPPTTVDLVDRNGYGLESHKVITEDGFILTLHRIAQSPSKDGIKRPVIFLQHGLMASSASFVSTGQNKSLAFFLADNGYDVWMGNSRGNDYSGEHNTYNRTDAAYWDFSWHEMGVYDLPASIDYVLEVTGQEKLNYIGHSMGTTMLFVLLSTKPEYNQKISHSFAMAPIVYFQGATTKLLIWTGLYYAPGLHLGGDQNCIPGIETFRTVVHTVCQPNLLTSLSCVLAYKILFGHSQQINREAVAVAFSTSMSKTSIKSFLHFRQNYIDVKFRHWRKGTNLNLVADNEHDSDPYPLHKVTAPVTLVYSPHDSTASEENILKLYNHLPNSSLYRVKHFNHVDFIFGNDAKDQVYKKLLKIMDKGRENDNYMMR